MKEIYIKRKAKHVVLFAVKRTKELSPEKFVVLNARKNAKET